MASKPHPVDAHVGSRLRARRRVIGMTQEQLGTKLGLTFQQVQKYERGTNRIGSSRLFELSNILGVPVTFFFDGMQEDVLQSMRGMAESLPQALEGQDLSTKETQDVLRAYYRIVSPKVRARMVDLMKAIGQADSDALSGDAH